MALDEDDTPWHFARFRRNPETPIKCLRKAHWFVQQYWLECDNFLFATHSIEMANVEHLTITLRRGDQWNYLDLQAIGIDPRWPAAVTAKRMREIWARDEAGEEVPYHTDAFGFHIQHLAKLHTFTLEIEGEAAQETELSDIVKHAKQYWSFPHHSGKKMIADEKVGVEKWAGPSCLATPRRNFQRVSEKAHLIKYALKFSVFE